ncbi:TatD family hydrolase [Mycoplasma sp. CB776]
MANFRFSELKTNHKDLFLNTNFENNPISFSKIEISEENFPKIVNFLKELTKKEADDEFLKGKILFLIDEDGEFDEIAAWFSIRKSNDSNNEIINNFGNIGYWVNPKLRQRGIGTLCLEKALELIKNEYNLDTCFITADKTNLFSQKIIEKFNPFFKKEIKREKESAFFYKLSTNIMENNLIDLHAHPFKEYYQNPSQEIQENFKNGIYKMFFVSTNWNENTEIMQEFGKHKNVFPVLGIHPNTVSINDDYKNLDKLITKEIVAIGEVGLDFYYEDNPPKDIQINSLIKQIDIAEKHNLPVILHIRDAFEDIYEIIKKYKNVPFVFHTYSGNRLWTEKFLEFKNVYFSFSGVITFKKNVESRKVIEMIPLERIFTETDAPYLTPEPFRSETNHSHYVKYTLETISLIKGISKEKMKQIILNNVKRVFGV